MYDELDSDLSLSKHRAIQNADVPTLLCHPRLPLPQVRLARPRIPPIHHIEGENTLLHDFVSTRGDRRRRKASARARHRPTVSSLSLEMLRDAFRQFGRASALNSASSLARSLPLSLLCSVTNELYTISMIHSGGEKAEAVAAACRMRTGA